MAPSTKKVQFQDLDMSFKTNTEDSHDSSEKSGLGGRKIHSVYLQKPSFQKSRFDFSSPMQNTEPSSVKELHKPDLEKLSLNELNNLLKKQEKIINNRKLLLKLRDKGEKATKFYLEIKKQIEMRKENDKTVENVLVKTEQMFEELTIKCEPVDDCSSVSCSPFKDAYSENRARKLDYNDQNTKRFNKPVKNESMIKIESRRNIDRNNKEVPIKLPSPREIKTLNYEESLRRLEITSRKEKDKLREQMIRFYTYRTRNDDESDEFDDDNDDYDSDDNYDGSIKMNLVNYTE